MECMTASTAYFPRNPKFTDAFERDLANDEASHLGRYEPSVFAPALKRLRAAFWTLVRTVHFLRASAQRPAQALPAS